MVYKNDIGFSNIRIPNEKADVLYTYSDTNTFPEEVFVHEFLHNLERVDKEYGNKILELHDYEKYGYKESKREGLKTWYKDYMNSNISNENIGLSKKVYTNKPIHASCFEETVDLTQEYFDEPVNLVDKIEFLVDKTIEYIKVEGEDNGSIRV